MEEIINIVIKIAATLLAFGAAWLGRYLVAWLKTNLDDKQDAILDQFIADLVAAAEQMYKKDDPDGSIRFDYVRTMLVEAGYDITEAIQAMIESKVFSINLATKGAEQIILEEVETPVVGFRMDEQAEEQAE